ncbi:integrin alpha [Nitrosomonas sp.]|uniref:integrin alpha n=1 Tax=Nitrosomonas sp. TaxID=42353 RepID=UPI0025F0C1D0|nr:integrin alpha [Nitrosomonas sp.]
MAISTINLSSLNGKNGFRLDGVAAFDFSGRPVSSAGDVNGDGFADVLVGAAAADSNGYNSGSSYVVFGKADGFDATLALSSLDGSNGFSLNGVAASDSLGSSVSSAGDVNGDGFTDVIVGALGAAPNGIPSGSSYVVFGKASGFDATLDLSSLDGSNGFRLDGVAARDLSGQSVSNAGDVNGDGFADVLVGAFGADPNGDFSGSSYVVFGKASGFAATLDLSSLDGSNGFRLDGVAAGDVSGGSLSSAGDVNGDGFADVFVGAASADPNGDFSGSSYVVFGKAAGFDATMNLASLDGSNGFRLDGAAVYDISGASLSSAGDVNGDGLADVIVGAPNAGSSYVVFGKATGFSATLDLSSLDGSNGFRLEGELDGAGFSVSGAGDVNGDGFADLIIGAPGGSLNGGYSGSSYVVFGKASGFGATMDLSSLDSDSGFRLDGAAYDFSSESVSSAGDVNGDGFADVMVGAVQASPGGVIASGSSYVVFGGNFNGAVTALGTSGADKLKGSKAVDRMVAGDGDDTLIGRGGADVFHAGAGDDTIEIRDVKFQLVDGGAGYDTLKLDRSHLDLDLSSVYGRISDIEAIDMKGNGHNTLTLTALNVLNLSSTSNTLTVDGNNNDSVVGLSSGWTDGGIDDGYHTFTNGAAVLLVGVHVMTDFA